MDRLIIPVLIVLTVVAYAIIDEQFKKVRQGMPAAQPGQVPGLQAFQVPGVPRLEPITPLPKKEAPEPAPDDFAPVPFLAPNKAFKISFPGRKPDIASFPVLVEGCRVTRYTLERSGAVFEVSEYDSGWDAVNRQGNARDWLKKCHEDQLAGMNAGESLARELTLDDGTPGIAFTALYSKNGRPRSWHGRVFLVGSRLYTASVYGDVNLVGFRAPAFLDSFELAPKPATGSPPTFD